VGVPAGQGFFNPNFRIGRNDCRLMPEGILKTTLIAGKPDRERRRQSAAKLIEILEGSTTRSKDRTGQCPGNGWGPERAMIWSLLPEMESSPVGTGIGLTTLFKELSSCTRITFWTNRWRLGTHAASGEYRKAYSEI
jgi:hypothetical protein